MSSPWWWKAVLLMLFWGKRSVAFVPHKIALNFGFQNLSWWHWTTKSLPASQLCLILLCFILHCSFGVNPTLACFGHPPIRTPWDNHKNHQNIFSQYSLPQQVTLQTSIPPSNVSTAALCNQTEYQTKAYINSKQSKD